MFKIRLYLYDSSQESNGYRGADLSKYVLQGQQYTEDITEVLDTSEITLAGFPQKESFAPETKFIADIVELHPTEDKSNSITHPKYPGSWLPYPIEYKHGKPKKNEIDEVQLAAQAMCLDYGQRVQNSVFECEVTDAQFCILKERIKDIIKSSSDSVRF